MDLGLRLSGPRSGLSIYSSYKHVCMNACKRGKDSKNPDLRLAYILTTTTMTIATIH